MNALLLAVLAFAPQAVAPQARLHPENPLVFAELPDMQALLEAYGDVASARMIADPEVRAAMKALWDSVQLDLDAGLDQLAQAIGLPPAAVRSPVATLVAYLDRVSGASLSISLDEATPGECAATILRVHACIAGLKALEDALYLYAVEHEGEFPAQLAELGPDAPSPIDPWGKLVDYARRADGSGFDLRSLGADGAKGGTAWAADLSARSDVAELVGGELLRRAGATLCVSFRRAEDAKAAHALLQRLASTAGLVIVDGGQPVPREVELTWYRPPRQERFPPCWLLRAEGLLAIGAGSSSPERLLERAAGKGPSALTSEGYRNLETRLGNRDGATVVRAFVDGADLVGALRTAIPAEVVNLTFVEPSAESVWRTGIEGGRFVTESFARPPGQHNRVAQCIAHRPVPETLWTFIPEEAIGVYATTIDAPRLFEMVLEALQAELRGAHKSKLSRLEAQYGFSLVDDVFGGMGDSAAVYLQPIAGLMGLPGSGLVIELDDAERFQKGLEALLRLLEDQAGGEFTVQSKPYRGAPFWFFSFQGSGAPIPISPTLAIQSGHLLVTLTSTWAKKEIKRLQDLEAPTPGDVAADPGSAAAVANAVEPKPAPRLHPARARAPADATAVGYMDWAQLFAGLYEGGRAAAGLFGGANLPFDVTLLPEAELFTQFYEPSIYWTEVGEDALHSHAESSLGPEVLLGAAMLAGGGAAAFKAYHEGRLAIDVPGAEEPAPDAGAPEPPEAPEGPVARQQGTRDSMRYLATRLAVYKFEAKRYPLELADLTRPTESYPRGFLDGNEVPLDAWQNPFMYAPSPDGTSYRLWSKGADGIDESGKGDDLVH